MLNESTLCMRSYATVCYIVLNDSMLYKKGMSHNRLIPATDTSYLNSNQFQPILITFCVVLIFVDLAWFASKRADFGNHAIPEWLPGKMRPLTRLFLSWGQPDGMPGSLRLNVVRRKALVSMLCTKALLWFWYWQLRSILTQNDRVLDSLSVWIVLFSRGVYMYMYMRHCAVGTKWSASDASSSPWPPWGGELGVRAGSDSVPLRAQFFPVTCYSIKPSIDFSWPSMSPKGRQINAKGSQRDANLQLFWRYTWKLGNDGFVHTKSSFLLFCSTSRTMCFNVLLATFFLQFVSDLDSKSGPGEGPQRPSNRPRTNIFITFSTWLSWGVRVAKLTPTWSCACIPLTRFFIFFEKK